MRSYTFLAKFEPSEDGGYGISFPDLPGCFSCGDSFDDAMHMAKEALELHVYGMEKDGDAIPESSGFDQSTFEGSIPVAITIYPDLVKAEMDNRKVKTNTSLPFWLKSIAEDRKVNYSKILEAALIDYLGLEMPKA